MDNIRAGEDMDQREMQMALIYKINAAGREVSPTQPNTHAHTHKRVSLYNRFCVRPETKALTRCLAAVIAISRPPSMRDRRMGHPTRSSRRPSSKGPPSRAARRGWVRGERLRRRPRTNPTRRGVPRPAGAWCGWCSGSSSPTTCRGFGATFAARRDSRRLGWEKKATQ